MAPRAWPERSPDTVAAPSVVQDIAILQPLRVGAAHAPALLLNESVLLGSVRVFAEVSEAARCEAPSGLDLGAFDRACGASSRFERGLAWSELFQVRGTGLGGEDGGGCTLRSPPTCASLPGPVPALAARPPLAPRVCAQGLVVPHVPAPGNVHVCPLP
jgi:hypothetical protein